MRIFTGEPQLISGGVVYLRIVSVSYLFTGISQIYLCILKNTDYAMKSMVIGSSAVVINLFLNAALIYGLWFFPEMGIAGAALATSISKLIEMAWAYAESLRKDRIRLHIKYCISAEQWLVRDYWKYTLPMLGDYLVWGVGFSMYSVIMGHLGSDAVAANSIANIAKNLIVSFCTGLGNGGGIIVGNELGTGNLEQAKRYGGLLWKLSIASGIVSGLLLVALSPLILNVTVLTPQASGYLQWRLILCACYMVAKAINTTTIAGIFPAGGDPVLLHCRLGMVVPGAYERILELRSDIPEIAYIDGAPLFQEYNEWMAEQEDSDMQSTRLLGGQTPEDALEYMKNTPNLVIVEVNAPEWKLRNGITGAMYIPYTEMAERYDEIPEGCPVLLHCGGGIVSVDAYEILQEKRPDIPELSYIAGAPPVKAYNEWLAAQKGE